MWEKYQFDVGMFSFGREYSSTHALSLMRVLVDERFSCIIQTPQETTVFYDANITTPWECEKYVCYELVGTGGFVELAGLIHRTSEVFAGKGIPIMYCTSYNYDLVFVPKTHEAQADELTAE